MYWSFKELKSRLQHKLNYLCVILTKSRIINNIDYFKYDSLNFYKLKDFINFLKLINKGKVKVTFKLSYYQKQDRYGEFYDKGTSFDLSYESLDELFERLDV